jgi:hypothetical protein
MIACRVKEETPEEPNALNDPTPVGGHLSETKVSLTEPLDHIAPICIIVSSTAWLG